MSDHEDAKEPKYNADHQLEQLGQRLNTHADQITRLTAEVSAMRHEPGPYVELVTRVQQLELDSDIMRRILAALEAIQGHTSEPTITVRQWKGQAGRWEYETTVTVKPETVTGLPNTLEYVDMVARAESRRREASDSQERGQMASGSSDRG